MQIRDFFMVTKKSRMPACEYLLIADRQIKFAAVVLLFHRQRCKIVVNKNRLTRCYINVTMHLTVVICSDFSQTLHKFELYCICSMRYTTTRECTIHI